MTLDEIIEAIGGKILTTFPHADIEVAYGFASDLMSDVLVMAEPQMILITGLTNPQSVRTAEMADIPAIIFVRGKYPQQPIVDLAEEVGIPILLSPYTMYETCGILYGAGLKGRGKVTIIQQQ
jgi:hypothetical protein